ncbi:hypothetical protein BJ742DRAFT_845242 [Cladochytrium replicatum]|nr:hypothetical protein BJ742DRAFT_845242 [Cladochytrium replicatum]
MGASTGPNFANGLQSEYPNNHYAQGVGGQYTAGLPHKFLPAGTMPTAIDESKGLFNLARAKCPSTAIVVGVIAVFTNHAE